MKKILSAIVAVAALASTADAKGFNGFYAGMDFGINQSNTKIRGADQAQTVVIKINGSGQNSNLGIFLGYNKVFSNCMALGAEYASDFNFSSRNRIESNYTSSFIQKRNTHSWSVLAKAGALVNPKTMFFVGLGIKGLKNKMEYSQYTNSSAETIKSNKARFTTQVGVENLMASDTMAVRVTYGYTAGNKKTVSISDINNAFAPGYLSSKTSEQLVKLGISYRF